MLDDEFHLLMYRCSGLTQTLQILQNLFDRGDDYWVIMHSRRGGFAKGALEEHEKILRGVGNERSGARGQCRRASRTALHAAAGGERPERLPLKPICGIGASDTHREDGCACEVRFHSVPRIAHGSLRRSMTSLSNTGLQGRMPVTTITRPLDQYGKLCDSAENRRLGSPRRRAPTGDSAGESQWHGIPNYTTHIGDREPGKVRLEALERPGRIVEKARVTPRKTTPIVPITNHPHAERRRQNG